MLACCAVAPARNLDSLWSVWNDPAQPDTNRLKAIHKYAWNGYLYTQPDSAFYFAQLGYDFAKSKGLKKYMAAALNIQGTSSFVRDDYTRALDYYTRCLAVREEIGDKKGIAKSLNNIGNVYYRQGDLATAIDCYTRSLTIEEEIGDKKGIGSSLNNIGNVYSDQGDLATALEYYTRCLTIDEEMGNKKGIAQSLNNIGIVYLDQGNYATALDYYTRSLTTMEEIGDKQGIANSLGNIGVVYSKQNDHATAIDYYTRGLTIEEEIGNKKGIASSLLNIGNIYYEQGDHATALDYQTRALFMAQEIGVVGLVIPVANTLYKSYKATGNHRKALEMHELYIVMRDSIMSEENQKEIMRQQFKYNYEKKEAVAETEHQKELEKRQVVIWAVSGGLLLLLLFALFIINRLRITRRQKTFITKQKDVIEQSHKEITDSIAYAKRIQNAILPPMRIVKEYLSDSFILYKPKDVVAGDFYWMEHKGGKVLFAAADCTGHGVPGAMVSVVCNNGLNRSVREYGLTDPGQILDKTREIVIQEFEKSDEEVKDGMDIALCALAGNILQYAGAHNPLWIIRNGEISETKADKQPIGKFDNPLPYTTHTFELQKGDALYIFSDGYVDQFGGEKGKKFKARAFKELLLGMLAKPMDEQRLLLNDAFEKWKGTLDQVDDVCIMGVRPLT